MTERATLSVKELADYLGIAYASASALTKRPGFPVFQVGKKRLIPKDALDKWLLEQRREAE